MNWRYYLVLLALGCAEFNDTAMNETDPTSQMDITTKSRDCVHERIQCEQECFYDHGQTFGTLNPFYNSCMNECRKKGERMPAKAASN